MLLKETDIRSLKYRTKETRALITPALIQDNCGFLIFLRTWGNDSKSTINHNNSIKLLWKSVNLKTEGNSLTYWRRRRWEEKKLRETTRMSLAEMSNCWKTQNYQNLSESFMKLLDLLICLREKLRNKFCLHQGIHLELRVLIFFFFVLSSRTMLPASLKKSVLKESSFEEKKILLWNIFLYFLFNFFF